MYFWKIDKLKEDIKKNRLLEKERFVYAVIYLTLSAIGTELMMFMPVENPNFWDVLSSFSIVLIILFGTFYAYKANGGASGADFLGRYFSIAFVVGIRFLLLLIPIILILVFYYLYAFPDDEDIPTTALDILLFIAWYVLLFWRIGVHIADVKNT